MLLARNPDADSTLPYLLRLPLGRGLVFRTKGTWPRERALYCHPVPLEDWPEDADIVERVRLRACARRGAAIDVVADRSREHRSQIVYTLARGREMVFWQSPKTRKQARPDVRLPTARASGLADLEIVVDVHERYAYSFATQRVHTVKRRLACGDYAVEAGGRVVAAVERKSMNDLVGSLTSGRLRFALGELATLPRAAVVVEDRFSQVFSTDYVRPSQVADGLAELQIRWPTVPIVYCETRKLAEEWTYRYLAAAHAWAQAELPALERIGAGDIELRCNEPGSSQLGDSPLSTSQPSSSQPSGSQPSGSPLSASSSDPRPLPGELRAWARAHGFAVSDRGRISTEIQHAWRQAQPG